MLCWWDLWGRKAFLPTWPRWVKDRTPSSQGQGKAFKVAFSFLVHWFLFFFLIEVAGFRSLYSQASFLLLLLRLCSLLFLSLSPGLLPPAFPWDCFPCLLLSVFFLCWFTSPSLSALKSVWAQAWVLHLSCSWHIPPRQASCCSWALWPQSSPVGV